jgi:hypothetical protein
MDSAISKLCAPWDLARDFIRLVKLWAINHSLVNHAKGFMNGVAWSLLVLSFLQREKLVPGLSDTPQGEKAEPPPVSKAPSFPTLLHKFFEWLTDHLQPGAPMSKSLVSGKESTSPADAQLFIEDPAEALNANEQVNLAKTLGEDQWATVMRKAKDCSDKLVGAANRWIHWAEVFDPRVVPTSSIPRLASLSDAVRASRGEAIDRSEGHNGAYAGKGKVGKERFDAYGSGKGSFAKGAVGASKTFAKGAATGSDWHTKGAAKGKFSASRSWYGSA